MFEEFFRGVHGHGRDGYRQKCDCGFQEDIRDARDKDIDEQGEPGKISEINVLVTCQRNQEIGHKICFGVPRRPYPGASDQKGNHEREQEIYSYKPQFQNGFRVLGDKAPHKKNAIIQNAQQQKKQDGLVPDFSCFHVGDACGNEKQKQ
jgi:hypothetical protein